MRWLCLVAFLGLVFPMALAAPVEGRLLVEGIRFDAAAVGALHLHALYANDTSAVTAFELEAERVELRIWRAEDAETRLTDPRIVYRLGTTEETWTLTDVRIRLSGSDHRGWLGVRWAPGATVALDPGAEVEFQPYSEIGETGNAVPDREAEDYRYFMEPLRRPHLLVGAVNALALDGNGTLRIAGLDLDLAARENRTRLATGHWRDEGPVGHARSAWVTLNFTNGRLRATDLVRAQAQAYAADLSWAGAATLREPDGALEETTRTWSPASPTEVLQGAFRAALHAQPDGIRVDLTGDLDTATMRSTSRAPAPAALALGALPWLLLVVGTLVGGGLALGLTRRRGGRDEPTTEELLDLALQASEAGDHERALAWVRRARARAPHLERLALEEAAILEAAGEEDRALHGYRDVAERTGSGEACWLLARGLARRGAHGDDVAPWIVRAVERDAMLVLEVDDDEMLAPFLRRADVRAALASAREKLA